MNISVSDGEEEHDYFEEEEPEVHIRDPKSKAQNQDLHRRTFPASSSVDQKRRQEEGSTIPYHPVTASSRAHPQIRSSTVEKMEEGGKGEEKRKDGRREPPRGEKLGMSRGLDESRFEKGRLKSGDVSGKGEVRLSVKRIADERVTGRGVAQLRGPGEAFSIAKPGRAKKSRADSYDSDYEEMDASVETVKKQRNGKKRKLKHKISMMVYQDRTEITLVKHFVETGEWKRVNKVEEAHFTYVANERKLDWEVSLKTMVYFL